MRQIQIHSPNGALTLAGKIADGLTQHAAALGITRFTAAMVLADSEALSAQRVVLEAARAVLRSERANRDALLKPARVFAVLARDTLKPHLGSRHGVAWAAAGFGTRLQVPQQIDQVILLLQRLGEFLATRPELEVAALNITAAKADQWKEDLTAARNAVKQKDVLVRDAVVLRNTKFRALKARIALVIKELNVVLSPLDNRWLDFRLNRPGAISIPAAPEGVKAVAAGDSDVAVQWEPSAGAKHYRVWKKVVDVDEDFVAAGSPADLDFLLRNVPSGKEVQVMVSAVNSSGESRRSKVVTVKRLSNETAVVPTETS